MKATLVSVEEYLRSSYEGDCEITSMASWWGEARAKNGTGNYKA